MPEAPSAQLWRVFRLYMATLSDAELETVSEQLERETLARRERDANAARLLFSTLTANELDEARHQILGAQETRALDRETLALMPETQTDALATASSFANSDLNLAGGEREQPQSGACSPFSTPSSHNSLACRGPQSDECHDRGQGRAYKENPTEMTTYTISGENNMTAFASASEAAQGDDRTTLVFDSKAELSRIAAEWPMSRLVEIYNSIPGHAEVKRFADRGRAVARIWEAIQPLGRNVSATAAQQADTNTPKPDNATRRRKPAASDKVAKPPQTARSAKSERAKKRKMGKGGSGTGSEGGSKKAAVIAMMKRAKGVTLSDIMAITGWQAHTVRGMVSILGSKGGVHIESSKNASGERTYRVTK
jgi:hypothetical protein